VPRLLLAALLALAALVLVACGAGASGAGAGGRPTSARGASAPGSYSSQPYNPVTGPLRCLRQAGLRAHHDGPGAIQVVPKGRGPRVVFAATPGDAQAAQIHGQAEGAEVIGNALVYPNAASDAMLKKVETCLAGSGLS